MATTADYGLGPNAFPRGWFMIAVAADVSSTPQAVHFFGKEMVLYRGKGSGRPILLDAFCPHMRVHIAKNTTSYIVRDGMQVEGDSIRCPAHGWRYNSKGQCDDIPYSTHGIPKSACLKSYTVEERAGCIFMWHDMEDGAPDFALPTLSEWDRTGEGWVRWTPDHLGTLPIHPQEILDNMSDIAHFAPVHGSTGTVYFENIYDGPIMRQRFGSGHRTLVDSEALLETDTWYTGPGILLCRMEGKHPSLMMICNTPVKDGEVRVWFAVMAKTADNHQPTCEEAAIARAYHESGLAAFAQDFELWQHKEPAISVLQIPDDGPFHKGRIWYRQFFHPRARAAEFQARVNGSHVTLRGKGEVIRVA